MERFSTDFRDYLDQLCEGGQLSRSRFNTLAVDTADFFGMDPDVTYQTTFDTADLAQQVYDDAKLLDIPWARYIKLALHVNMILSY